jgi:alpha-1,3-glucan synthase
MGDLIGFKGYLNASTPFTLKEHQVEWRDPERRYLDFAFGNRYNRTCQYPRFWQESGYPVGNDVTDQMVGCYNSEFDQVSDAQ